MAELFDLDLELEAAGDLDSGASWVCSPTAVEDGSSWVCTPALGD